MKIDGVEARIGAGGPIQSVCLHERDRNLVGNYLSRR